MTDEAKMKKREYYQRWRDKNREKIRAYNEAYWEKRYHKEQSIRIDAQKAEENKERFYR